MAPLPVSRRGACPTRCSSRLDAGAWLWRRSSLGGRAAGAERPTCRGRRAADVWPSSWAVAGLGERIVGPGAPPEKWCAPHWRQCAPRWRVDPASPRSRSAPMTDRAHLRNQRGRPVPSLPAALARAPTPSRRTRRIRALPSPESRSRVVTSRRSWRCRPWSGGQPSCHGLRLPHLAPEGFPQGFRAVRPGGRLCGWQISV